MGRKEFEPKLEQNRAKWRFITDNMLFFVTAKSRLAIVVNRKLVHRDHDCICRDHNGLVNFDLVIAINCLMIAMTWSTLTWQSRSNALRL